MRETHRSKHGSCVRREKGNGGKRGRPLKTVEPKANACPLWFLSFGVPFFLFPPFSFLTLNLALPIVASFLAGHTNEKRHDSVSGPDDRAGRTAGGRRKSTSLEELSTRRRSSTPTPGATTPGTSKTSRSSIARTKTSATSTTIAGGISGKTSIGTPDQKVGPSTKAAATASCPVHWGITSTKVGG